MANSDIQLIVGANTTESYKQLKTDIEGLIARFNNQKSTVKIKVGVQLDNKTQIRSQLLKEIQSVTSKLSSSSSTNAKIKLEIDKSYIERQYKSVISSIAKGKFADIGGLSLISSETLDKTKADAQQLKQIIAEFQKGTLSDKTIKLLGVDSSKLETDVKKVEDVAKRLANANKNLITVSKGIKGLQGVDVSELTARWKELQAEMERARTLEGEEQATALSAIESKTAALQQEIVTMQGLANIQEIEGRAAVETAKEETAARKEAEAAAKSNAKSIREESSAYNRQLTLIKQIQDYLKSNSKVQGTAYGSQLNNMLSMLTSGKRLDSSVINTYTTSFKELKNNIAAAGLAGKSFSDTVSSGLKKFSSWFGISQLVMRAVTGVKQMITTVTELDTAMTELRKVTDLTEQEYAKFGNTASNIAKNVGATISDTINSAADFARLGYSIDESAKLAEAALVYKNVGDGINDIGEASESIISTIKAFGIEAENAMGIVDRFNEVGNNFAISSEGIGTALKKSAASLATSGNSIEESIGLATGMNTVIQNPETVGTALKTLTMYLRAAKVEAQEAGEETEGMANSVAELQDSILTLTKGKVDIMADANNFKSTYQIMKEISEVWGDMAEVDQAALLKLIAGKRNANVVTSLITNFKDAEEAMKAASEATGSATAENEKYLNSIEGRKARLKASFETISTDIFDSDSLKNTISALTTIVDLVDKFVNLAGATPALIASIAAGLSLKNVGFFKLIESDKSASGLKMHGDLPSWLQAFRTKDLASFSSGFSAVLESDTKAIQGYVNAVNGGMDATSAFDLYLSGASQGAQAFAKGLEVIDNQIQLTDADMQVFANQQAQLEVSNIALDKSFVNCKKIINEYNSGCKNTGLSQKDFISAVGQSNRTLGKYLSGLNGAKGGVLGYTGALVKARVQTVALKAATMILNAAISMGISVAISKLMTAISDSYNKFDNLAEKIGDVTQKYKDAQDTIKSHKETIDSISGRYEELSGGVNALGENVGLTSDEFKEYNSICNQIADMYPSLVEGHTAEGNAILSLKGNVEGLTEAYREEIKAANDAVLVTGNDIDKAFEKIETNANGESYNWKDRVNRVKAYFGDGLEIEKSTQEFLSLILDSPNMEKTIRDMDYTSGVQKVLKSTLKNLDIDLGDYDGETFADKIVAIFKDPAAYQKIKAGVDQFNTEFASAVEPMKSYLNAYLGNQLLDDKSIASGLSEGMQGIIRKMFSNIDYQTLVDNNIHSTTDLVAWANGIIESLSSVDNEKITAFLEIQTKYNNDKCTSEQYDRAVNSFKDAISNLSEDTQNQIIAAVDLDDDDFVSKYNKVLKTIQSSSLYKKGQGLDEWMRSLTKSELDIAYHLSLDEETADWDLQTWKDKVRSEGVIKVALNFDAKATEESFANIQKAIQESLKNTSGVTEESRNNLFAIYGDVPDLFDRTATGIRLNTNRLKELQDQQKELQDGEFKEALSDLYTQYEDLSGQIINNTNLSDEEYDALVDKRNAVVDNINALSDYISEYEGLTSTYAEWQAALANGEDGDMYDSIRTEYEKAKELFDKNLVGTSEFESYMKLLTGKDWSNASFDEIKKGWIDLDKEIKNTGYSVKDFLGDNEQGVINFLNAAAKINGSGVTKKNGLFSIDIDNTAALAEKLGVSVDFVESMLTKLRDYKFNIDFKSETESLEKLTTTAQEASENLRALKLTDVKFDFTTTNDESLTSQLEEAKRLFDSIKNEDGTINMKADGASDIITVYKRLLTQKQQLDSPIVMDVDISKIEDTDIAEDIKEIQDYIRIHNKIQVEAALGHDTTELQNQLAEKLKAISKDNKILAGLDIDEKTSYEDIVAKVDEWSKNPDNTKILVGAGIDESRLDQEAEKVREYIQNAVDGIQIKLDFDNKYLQGLFGGTITINADTSDADSKLDNTQAKKDKVSQGTKTTVTADTSDANGKLDVTKSKEDEVGKGAKAVVTADASDASSKLSTIVGYLFTIVSRIWNASVTTGEKKATNPIKPKPKTTTTTTSNGGSKPNGAVKGKSDASGDIGAKQTEVALMGEVAPELWVHADTGTWELVDKPQFRKVKKGDVIFNGNQTKELLRQGIIDSYGRSFLGGTAYRNGASGGGYDITSSKDSKNTKSTKDDKSTKKKTNKTTENEKDPTVFDWIEVAIDRIERAISNLKSKVEDTFSSWGNRNKALSKEIDSVTEEITIQEKAATKYQKKADAIGLSSTWKKKIQDGSLNIDEVKSDSLKEKIQAYQNWYEKVLDCKDSIQELKSELNDLNQEKFDNWMTRFDNSLQSKIQDNEILKSNISRRNADASSSNTIDYSTEAAKSNISDYKSIISNNDAIIAKRQTEIKKLQKIQKSTPKNTEAWYKQQEEINNIQNDINDLKEDSIDASNEIAQAYITMFDNIGAKFDITLSDIEHRNNILEEQINQIELSGHMVNESFYKAQSELNNQNQATLEAQLAQQQQALNEAVANGSVKVGSEDWKNMISEINETAEGIEGCKTKTIEFNKAIRDLHWETFDMFQERVSNINSESDFLIDLLSRKDLFDDKGKFTDEGNAVFGLRVTNMETYTRQAQEYANEIARLDAEYANDSLNTDYLDRRQELIELQRDCIKNTEDEKDAIVDLIQDGIDAELNALQELIDKRKDALQAQKDLYDYQKNIKNQAKEIASLEKQLSAYSGDISEETKAKIQQIKVSLEEAQENLREIEYDKYISDQEQLLDDLYDEYEEVLNSRLDDVSALIQGVIDTSNANTDKIANTINGLAGANGYSLQSIGEILGSAQNGNILDAVNNAVNAIKALTDKIASGKDIPEGGGYAGSSEGGYPSAPETYSPSADPNVPPGFANNHVTLSSEVKQARGIKDSWKSFWVVGATESGYTLRHFTNKEATEWQDFEGFKLNELQQYASGTKSVKSNQFAWTQEDGTEAIIRKSDGAILTPLGKGDTVFNSMATENLWKLANNPYEYLNDNFAKMISKINTNSIANRSFDGIVENNITITLPNVQNYDDFKRELQKDKSFEKMIQSMTVDRITGGSSFGKYKY